jgi:hypothetical protein
MNTAGIVLRNLCNFEATVKHCIQRLHFQAERDEWTRPQKIPFPRVEDSWWLRWFSTLSRMLAMLRAESPQRDCEGDILRSRHAELGRKWSRPARSMVSRTLRTDSSSLRSETAPPYGNDTSSGNFGVPTIVLGGLSESPVADLDADLGIHSRNIFGASFDDSHSIVLFFVRHGSRLRIISTRSGSQRH